MTKWKLNDRVRIGPMGDDIGDKRYTGLTGTVTGFEHGDVGASPGDPLVIVILDTPIAEVVDYEEGFVRDSMSHPELVFRVTEQDGFWSEELVAWA